MTEEMTKLLKRLLWFLFCAVVIGAFIVGQITHKEIMWLANPSWFFAWTLILREIVLVATLSNVDAAISGKKPLSEGLATSLRDLLKHSFSSRLFNALHRIIDLVMTVALACAGWFFSATIYLICSQMFVPELMKTLEVKCRKHFENENVDDVPEIVA